MELIDAAFSQVDKIAADVPQSSGSFTVNKDNVLAAAKIIQTQADTLGETLKEKRRDLRIPSPGDDDVSIRVAQAWNDRLVDNEDSYSMRVEQYVDSLNKLVGQLTDTAKAYGFTEDAVAAAFRGRSA